MSSHSIYPCRLHKVISRPSRHRPAPPTPDGPETVSSLYTSRQDGPQEGRTACISLLSRLTRPGRRVQQSISIPNRVWDRARVWERARRARPSHGQVGTPQAKNRQHPEGQPAQLATFRNRLDAAARLAVTSAHPEVLARINKSGLEIFWMRPPAGAAAVGWSRRAAGAGTPDVAPPGFPLRTRPAVLDACGKDAMTLAVASTRSRGFSLALLGAAIPFACLLWAYGNTLVEMAQAWNTHAEYSHGYLVPGFAAVLLWLR